MNTRLTRCKQLSTRHRAGKNSRRIHPYLIIISRVGEIGHRSIRNSECGIRNSELRGTVCATGFVAPQRMVAVVLLPSRLPPLAADTSLKEGCNRLPRPQASLSEGGGNAVGVDGRSSFPLLSATGGGFAPHPPLRRSPSLTCGETLPPKSSILVPLPQGEGKERLAAADGGCRRGRRTDSLSRGDAATAPSGREPWGVGDLRKPPSPREVAPEAATEGVMKHPSPAAPRIGRANHPRNSEFRIPNSEFDQCLPRSQGY